jgi:transcriptional regulator with XRE-family HTH domain
MDFASFAAEIPPNQLNKQGTAGFTESALSRQKLIPRRQLQTMQVQQLGRLSQFVKQLMTSRQMTIHEIRRNATAEITESYISGIVKGSSCNPSVRKLVALASGLGVDPVELFRVAAGLEREHEGPQSLPSPDPVGLISLMKKIASDDKLLDIMGEAVLLENDDRPAALDVLRSLNQARLAQTRTARPV